MEKNDTEPSVLARRDLFKAATSLAGALVVGTSAEAAGQAKGKAKPAQKKPVAKPEPKLAPEPPVEPVTVAVIGAGDRGKEILTSLSYVRGAVVKYVCDSYSSAFFQKKALENAPKATFVSDYKQVLSDPAVKGVFVATPTHQHKQIVLDALAAGKHVYCEAPLAHTIDEAREIAIAGRDAKTIFQAGLQSRTNPQHHHVKHFVDLGSLGSISRCTAQWNLKNSWRRTAPTDERQSALNWRLNKDLASGLVGEIGIHQVDVASWYLKGYPTAISGFGSVNQWKDGRAVADSIACIFEYANGVRLTYDATLCNSFGGNFELFQGDSSAVMLRGVRAWMFKESDAPALGWEVYARKEQVGDEQGIMLIANASKIIAQGMSPADFVKPKPNQTPLYFACDTFLKGIRVGKEKSRPTVPVVKEGEAWSAPEPVAGDASAEVGFAATVVAIKANEAILSGTKILLDKALLTL